MQEVFGLLAAVAPTEATVLVLGETGTGKELVAQEIHRQSPRSGRPLVVLDCGSIPAELIESELFGHIKGAFTGAHVDRAGVFEQASGGTVFLDEIGELPAELQTRLLRVLDQRTVRRVGSHRPQKVDLRVVAATNRNLEGLVAEGRFRQDLFYRLSVVEIRLPPLRQRPEDIPLLARHFLRQSGCANPDDVLTPEVLEVLATRRWPGNARELRNVVERAVILQDGISAGPPPAEAASLTTGDADWLARAIPGSWLDRPYKELKGEVLDRLEAKYLRHLLDHHGHNISRLAGAAGIDRHLMRKLLRKHNLWRAEGNGRA
jgi:DNA-binding NtrC family response regulator